MPRRDRRDERESNGLCWTRFVPAERRADVRRLRWARRLLPLEQSALQQQFLAGRDFSEIVGIGRVVAAKQARSFAQTLHKARRELRELKGIVERGRHRMDERALKDRIGGILKRRWLAEILTVDADLGARRLTFRTDHTALGRVRRREFGKRIIFTDRHDWSDEQIVAAYRAQPEAEGAFRQMKTPSSPPSHPPTTGPTKSCACTPSTAHSRSRSSST